MHQYAADFYCSNDMGHAVTKIPIQRSCTKPLGICLHPTLGTFISTMPSTFTVHQGHQFVVSVQEKYFGHGVTHAVGAIKVRSILVHSKGRRHCRYNELMTLVDISGDSQRQRRLAARLEMERCRTMNSEGQGIASGVRIPLGWLRSAGLTNCTESLDARTFNWSQLLTRVPHATSAFAAT